MTDIRWGILATGGIAHAFTADLRTAGLDVAAVGSRRSEAARAFAEQYDIPHAHGSYDELVADPDVDIVYVASPHSHHLEHATLALEAGKHVLIEKAVTLDADEARALRDLAAARGLLVMEAMWTRYLPHMVRIREIVAAGTLGEVRIVSADHTQRLPAIRATGSTRSNSAAERCSTSASTRSRSRSTSSARSPRRARWDA